MQCSSGYRRLLPRRSNASAMQDTQMPCRSLVEVLEQEAEDSKDPGEWTG